MGDNKKADPGVRNGAGALLVVHFDQNCLNTIPNPILTRLEAFAAAGVIELRANPRNDLELGEGRFARESREWMADKPVAPESFRLDVSRLDFEGFGAYSEGTTFTRLWRVMFPGLKVPVTGETLTKTRQSAVHDVMHVANAEDTAADVLLSRDSDLLNAREKLGLRVRIMTPEELVAELEGRHDAS